MEPVAPLMTFDIVVVAVLDDVKVLPAAIENVPVLKLILLLPPIDELFATVKLFVNADACKAPADNVPPFNDTSPTPNALPDAAFTCSVPAVIVVPVEPLVPYVFAPERTNVP